MKSRYLVLAFSAFIFSIIAIIIAAINVSVVITHETFVGTIAAFIAICTTFLVGYQIFNAILIKDELKEIKGTSKELDEKIIKIDSRLKQIDDILIELKGRNSLLAYHTAFTKAIGFSTIQPASAISCYIEALFIAIDEDLIKHPNAAYHDIFHNISLLLSSQNGSINFIANDMHTSILEDIKELESHKNFHLILNEFKPIKTNIVAAIQLSGAI